MIALHLILLVAAVVVSGAIVCRLDALQFKRHRWSVIGMHVALLVATASAGVHAWQRTTDVIDVCVVLAAGLWIWLSFPSWRLGVPVYMERHKVEKVQCLGRQTNPGEVKPPMWREIFGGCKR